MAGRPHALPKRAVSNHVKVIARIWAVLTTVKHKHKHKHKKNIPKKLKSGNFLSFGGKEDNYSCLCQWTKWGLSGGQLGCAFCLFGELSKNQRTSGYTPRIKMIVPVDNGSKLSCWHHKLVNALTKSKYKYNTFVKKPCEQSTSEFQHGVVYREFRIGRIGGLRLFSLSFFSLVFFFSSSSLWCFFKDMFLQQDLLLDLCCRHPQHLTF